MKRQVLLLVLLGIACSAQQPPVRVLTLKEAQAIALRQHPRVGQARSEAQAAGQVAAQLRSAYFPTVGANLTGAGALNDSRIAAGGLNNPLVYDRLGVGFSVSQLITDFSRTGNLVESAKLHAKAQESAVTTTRAQVVEEVDRTFYSLLRAQAVLKVAQQTVAARRLGADQADILAKNKLKSELDVSFAKVNLSDAELLLVSAENELQAAQTDFSTALGFPAAERFRLVEEPLPPRLPATSDNLVKEALNARPEVATLRLEESSAEKFARAERALIFPTVSSVFTVGATPVRQHQLDDRWAAVGLNFSLPVLNGRLFSARRKEAEFRVAAAQERLRNMEYEIGRDVRVAWLNAKTAYDRLDLTKKMLDQANLAYQLAQSRYNLGLSSIVELSQAQLSQTAAEIAGVSARYEYQLRRAILDYTAGANL